MPYALLNGVCREDREWPHSGSSKTSDNARAELVSSSVLMIVPDVSSGEETKIRNVIRLTQIDRN